MTTHRRHRVSTPPKYEPGQIYQPPEPRIAVTEIEVRGPTWRAWTEGELHYLEFLVSRHGGGEERYVIFAEEFQELRAGRITFDELRQRYDVV